MLIVAGTVQLDPAQRETNLAAIQAMMAASQAEAGCLAYVFSQDMADPNLLHLYELWADDEALALHRQSSHMALFAKETIPTFAKVEIKRFRAEAAK